ncbi:MAG TPA: hypothetical protein VL049_13775 [Candidatus Dormibacteraeota bacterium]|nr:hypothetical protein [Candidatus Dormibacteraeota bacterium]
MTGVVVGLIYLVAASQGTFRFGPSTYPHHILVADAWLHGQIHVRESSLAAMSPNVLVDWAVIDGKRYGYWGPMPALLLVPFVAVSGLQASDRLLSCLVGAGTVLLTFLMLREARRQQCIAAEAVSCSAVALLLGLGTVHFYLTVIGQVWFLSQTVAAFFLTLAMWAVLRTDRGLSWAALAGAGFGAALLSRIAVLPTALFFPFALLAVSREARGERAWRLRAGIAFAAPIVLAGAIMLWFNYARFGNPFENGLGIAVETGAVPHVRPRFREYGAFNLHYLPTNFYYYFLNVGLRRDQPSGAVSFDPMGNSMFLVTPALLYVFVSGRQRNWLIVGAWAGAAATLGMLLCYFATGWYNFGTRYLLDLMPLLMLLVAAGMRGRLTVWALLLIVASIEMNAWGLFRFALEQG